MTAEQLFSVLNPMTLAAWLLLVFLPRVRWTSTVVPVVFQSFSQSSIGARGYEAIGDRWRVLISVGREGAVQNPWMLLAGWTHYLAFDLFIGGWEVRDAHRRGIPHLLIVPALVLTFLLGRRDCCSIWRFDGSRLTKGATTSAAAEQVVVHGRE